MTLFAAKARTALPRTMEAVKLTFDPQVSKDARRFAGMAAAVHASGMHTKMPTAMVTERSTKGPISSHRPFQSVEASITEAVGWLAAKTDPAPKAPPPSSASVAKTGPYATMDKAWSAKT